MIKIRLARYGNVNRPFYRVVAINSKQKTTGKFLEVLGTYNPIKSEINIDKVRVQEWIKKGAQISQAVSFLLQGKPKPKKIKLEKKEIDNGEKTNDNNTQNVIDSKNESQAETTNQT